MVDGLAEGGGDDVRGEAQALVVVAVAVDVLDEHVHLSVVALGGQFQQLVESLRPGDERAQTPEGAPARRRTSYPLEFAICKAKSYIQEERIILHV